MHDRVKFRVGQIVYVAFSRDETVMGFAFPKEERELLVELRPRQVHDAARVRHAASTGSWCGSRGSDATEMRELVLRRLADGGAEEGGAAYGLTSASVRPIVQRSARRRRCRPSTRASKRFVIGRRRSRPNAFVEILIPGGAWRRLYSARSTIADHALDVLGGQAAAHQLHGVEVLLHVAGEDRVEHVVGRQRVLVALLVAQLGRGRPLEHAGGHELAARPARCASATSR